MKYALVDMSNLIFRARYGMKSKDPDEVIGFAIHITMMSMLKVYEQFGATKMVCMFDSSSWRKAVYPEYKAQRGTTDTPEDIAVKESIYEMLGIFYEYLRDQTNVTTLKFKNMEADDFIARWIQTHKNDDHIILSSDSDFRQLLAPNVELFDAMSGTLYQHDGAYFQDGKKPKKDELSKTLYRQPWKVKMDGDVPLKIDSDWYLFEKIMRGDKVDNISSVVPPRYRTTKIRAMFEDMEALYAFLSEYREDLEDKPRIGDLFERNMSLIDMSQLPELVIQTLDDAITAEKVKLPAPMIGMNFLKFCKKFDLVRISESAHNYANMLAA